MSQKIGIMMNIKILEKFEVLNSEMLASVEGGKKVVSMGNGMYCTVLL